jgi:uncharacterized protein HemX
MTTTQTPAPPANPSTAKTFLKPAILLLALFVVVGFGVALVLGTVSQGVENGTESRIASMQSSLESHGITAEGDLAERVMNACRATSSTFFEPLSTTIVQDYNGKKSVITLMCGENASISDFAAIPVP